MAKRCLAATHDNALPQGNDVSGDLPQITLVYRLWVRIFEAIFRRVDPLVTEGYSFDSFEEVQHPLTEARELVGNLALEPFLSPSEQFAQATPFANPDPARFGDGSWVP